MDSEPQLARVAIVDDQRSFADALTLALSLTEDLRVVGVAGDADSGYDLVVNAMPDLVVIDYRLSGPETGVDLATRIRETPRSSAARAVAKTPILILTGYAAPQVLRGAKKLCAVSVLSKNNPIAELIGAFRRTLNGEPVAVPEIDDIGLTPAEFEVLEMLGEGLQAAQIADRLYLSVHAIRGRIKTMLKKMEVNSQLEAVAKATRLGLLVPPGASAQPPESSG